ncbi:hypothetical protein MMC09_007080 [Bachmanniomyces sp. S44760]|nr:hypothetical protein [Bachmanniomyces sp. S44760]
MARPDLSEMEKMWLAPLLDVRGLKTFQLRISYERAFPGEDEPKVTKEMANFRKKIAKTVRKPRVETRRLVESGDPEDGVQVTYCECCGGVESMYDKSNGARWEQDVRMHGEELGCMAATDVI